LNGNGYSINGFVECAIQFKQLFTTITIVFKLDYESIKLPETSIFKWNGYIVSTFILLFLLLIIQPISDLKSKYQMFFEDENPMVYDNVG